MKRSITIASLAVIAVTAFSAPAQAQWGSQYNQYNAQLQSHNGLNSHFGNQLIAQSQYGSGFNSSHNVQLNSQFGNGFNSRFGGGINVTQAQLQARITAGISSGKLTRQEAAKLQAKLSRINTLEARLRSTGNRLSFGERQRLNNQLSQLNAQITREMNDFDRRFASRRGGWR
jgi:hypothetical protein